MIQKKQFFKDHDYKSKGLPILDKILHDAMMEEENKLLDQDIDKSDSEEKKDKEESEEEEEVNYATMAEFAFEADRHRIIAAMIISDFFLFLLKHLKGNHVVQFIYVSQLLVDANGVLVLLKFLN